MVGLRVLALLLVFPLLHGCLKVELYGSVVGADIEIAPLRGGAPAVTGLTSAGVAEDVELRRLARGWRRTLAVCERLKRLDEGRPILELVRD